jgi:hypothetical protein
MTRVGPNLHTKLPQYVKIKSFIYLRLILNRSSGSLSYYKSTISATSLTPYVSFKTFTRGAFTLAYDSIKSINIYLSYI